MNKEQRKEFLARLRSEKNYWEDRLNGKKVPKPSDDIFGQDNDGNELGKIRTMGTNPAGGNSEYYQSENEIPSTKAGFTSGLILAGITFIMELLFLVISYFIYK